MKSLSLPTTIEPVSLTSLDGIARLVSILAAAAAPLVAFPAGPIGIELEWSFPDGRVERERREVPENDGVVVFGLHRDEIAGRHASSVAIVRKLKYYFKTRVVAKDGEYRMSCVLDHELCTRPYEDFEIEFRRLEGREATMGGMARAYRAYQFGRGAAKPLKERAAVNSILKSAIESPEIRIRQAWKPVSPTILDQAPENEPPVTPYVTFDRVVDIARALKTSGVAKAELCLVGWNIGGR